MRTLLDPAGELPASAFDARRGQHSSTRILDWMESRLPPDGAKALALTDADLFIPILTFVFGEARLGGRAAVVSSARLLGDGVGAGLLVVARLAKEAAHELGHTFGLLHCERPRCVMTRSASLLDVDRKGAELCHDCQIRLASGRRAEVSDERR